MVSTGRKRGTTRFSIEPRETAKDVWLAGDFTHWEPRRMRRYSRGAFVLTVPLPPGVYQYKFVVDGQWITDPDNGSCAGNPYGTSNSVASVEPPLERHTRRDRDVVPSTADALPVH